MTTKEKINFQIFDDNLHLFTSMLDDIEAAQKYVYLETYKYMNDPIGIKIRDTLIKKARQGVEVIVLIDSWGASISETFFADLIKAGGEFKFFKKIKFSFDIFTKSHRRNHNKLLIIDDKISYLGSANITNYSVNWRELSIRLTGEIALCFKKAFFDSFKLHNKYIYDKVSHSKTLKYKDFEILRDVPSTVFQRIRKRYLELIKNATTEVIIETPYFLPGSFVRKALMESARRGVQIKIIVPLNSDVGLIDIIRSRYFGEMHKAGIEIFFYYPQNLHAKVLMIDNKIFSIATSNFDYRSFRFQHEMALVGTDKGIIRKLQEHFAETMNSCEYFNYELWKDRPMIQRLFERLLIPFRHFF